MATLFMVCAVIGVTVMVCQFALTLLGIVDIDDFDVPHAHADADVAAFDGHADAVHGDASHADAGQGHDAASEHHHTQHGSHWLFGVISFRTVIAALAFFGLSGLAARSAGLQPDWLPLLIALAAGWAAMYAVHWIMKTLFRLRSEGNVRIEYSVGKLGSVYLRIPANRSGNGKITLNLQNRTMEYLAVTPGEALPTGANIVVVGVVGPDTVEVQPAPQPAATGAVAGTV
jgi:hypothetical protein